VSMPTYFLKRYVDRALLESPIYVKVAKVTYTSTYWHAKVAQ
jgi:hypothetical protein